MHGSDAVERVLAASCRTELIDAVTAGAGEVVTADGVRVAELQMVPDVEYRVLGQRLPAPDPSPTIVRSPLGHPIVAAYVATRFRGWVSMQDLLGRDWLEHPLYRDVYRPLGLRAQISCALRDTGAAMHSLSLNRAGRDFSEREREQLEQFRRFVAIAWRQLEERVAVRAALEAPDDHGTQAAVLVFTPDPVAPRAVYCSAAMTRLLAADPELAETIRRAVRTGAAPTAPALSAGRTVRLSILRSADAVVVRAAALNDLPLTNREQQVLRALARGGTAHAIGSELGISERTVQKHLENIYAKVGVHDRLDAVLLARRAGIG